MPKPTPTIYQRHGYESRRDYLRSLAEDHGVSEEIVFTLADLLGPREDFDGLVAEVEDYAFFHPEDTHHA